MPSLLATLDLALWMGVYASIAGALAGPVVAVLWAPFLVANRLRALFELGPTGHWSLNYVVASVTATAVYGFVLGTGLTLGSSGTNPSLGAIILVGLLTAGAVWAVPGAVLPASGYDWDPTAFDATTHLLLLLGGVWYAAVVTVPVFLVSMIFYLPT